MRIRTLKPEFWASLTLDKLNYAERLTFIGLWNYADDEGRGLADERLIKAAIWPLDRKLTAPVVAEMLRHMASLGLLILYEDGGRPYFSVTHWGEHQAVSKPRPSRLPEPSGNGTGNLLAGKERNREQGTGKGTGLATQAPPQESSWTREEMFEAVAEACGIDWHDLTDEARGPLNKATASLMNTGAAPSEVRRRADNWPSLFDPDTTLTPMALVKHWPALGRARVSHSRTIGTAAALAAELEAQGR